MNSPQEEWVSLAQKNATGLIRLQMSGSSKRLNQIDRIRAKGVGDHISLPQLVVCGDQSAGKSSVLEGITGVPFPRQDGVCTRFATEIILRHCPDKNEIMAKLLPSATRTEEERLRMTSFARQLTGFDDLPRVIKEASALMGIRTSTNPDLSFPAFASDILRLEVIGNTGLHLTVVDGSYGGRDAVFFGAKKKVNNRLRASIHLANENFAAYMRTNAAQRRVVDARATSSESDRSESSHESETSDEEGATGQLRVTQEQMMEWVKKIYLNNRGRELPGTYNQEVLSELFHEQSSRWGDISSDHLRTVSSIVKSFVCAVLDHVIVDDEVRSSVRARIRQSLDANFEKARSELQNILLDEAAHPITYNHYYTDNIQNARADAAKKHLQTSMDYAIANEWNGKLHVSNTQVDLKRLCSSLKNRVVVDMTEQACEESLEALNAYYKVATKTFVDNVCRQVVERHLISGLVAAFDPVFVGKLSDEELLSIASESDCLRARRKDLQALKKALEGSVLELDN
ncbi:Interferon-induced GTP-binding protein Mx2 [Stagonosporopsis vannaccii]|nr:Interferon-induced GTP-binding protein Mx2 [Stagonosporopsis vannaccii]